MRVVVVGATGNVGTSVVSALRQEKSVSHVVGLARRLPDPDFDDIEWRQVDITTDDLSPHFQHADAIIHLAWLQQPARQLRRLHDVNILGTGRVFEAAAKAEVGALLYASSVGAYSRAPDGLAVDESWPTDGIAASMFSQQKAYVERLLDRFEYDHPFVRVVRLRLGLTFKSGAASEIQRLFLGRILPWLATPAARCSVLPDVPGLAFQTVHTDDVAEAFRLALLGSVTGAFNIAAEPVIDASTLAREFELRRFPLSARVARTAAALGWNLHVAPAEPGWIDLGLYSPLVETTWANKELGWVPRRSAIDTMRELAKGMMEGGGLPTAPLRPGPGMSH